MDVRGRTAFLQTLGFFEQGGAEEEEAEGGNVITLCFDWPVIIAWVVITAFLVVNIANDSKDGKCYRRHS